MAAGKCSSGRLLSHRGGGRIGRSLGPQQCVGTPQDCVERLLDPRGAGGCWVLLTLLHTLLRFVVDPEFYGDEGG